MEKIYPGSTGKKDGERVTEQEGAIPPYTQYFNAPDAEMARNVSEHDVYSDDWGLDW